jgi:hypothetical protein
LSTVLRIRLAPNPAGLLGAIDQPDGAVVAYL